MILPRTFFDRPACELAPVLLNKLLLVGDPGSSRSASCSASCVGGRIAEVEAYDQSEPASHSFNGPTPRCEVMFGAAGFLYVYRSYGIHWCANVVCGDPGWGAAILIRALVPTHGLHDQRQRREKAKTDFDLCSGPGKLCAALGLSDADNGADLANRTSRVAIFDDGTAPPRAPRQGPRIGITKAVERPWRWWLADCKHVSSPRR